MLVFKIGSKIYRPFQNIPKSIFQKKLSKNLKLLPWKVLKKRDRKAGNFEFHITEQITFYCTNGKQEEKRISNNYVFLIRPGCLSRCLLVSRISKRPWIWKLNRKTREKTPKIENNYYFREHFWFTNVFDSDAYSFLCIRHFNAELYL